LTIGLGMIILNSDLSKTVITDGSTRLYVDLNLKSNIPVKEKLSWKNL
jgi:hypothetical protein